MRRASCAVIRGKIEGGGPVDSWQLVSRAIKYGGHNGSLIVEKKERFSKTGHWWTSDEKGNQGPLLAIEGYVLDTGDFITREEAKKLFPATHIHWETGDFEGNDAR